nr:hypothetical protein Iba_chr07aCG2430 [Ipomoea batatas]GMD14040.1 hypothetical protein Iba_chr07bCG2550 [Ipomoea batatas]GMD15728.1 hypothetical protein Iba_chr07cCG2540 [Ipomoea batatas]GMD17325.1 hypothetical protein Iba_chr07dCG2490 [Ipomoea batatas]GMD18790.1 hypothetical protein Iba_chr07eCG2560 [Ipomoea batatas]
MSNPIDIQSTRCNISGNQDTGRTTSKITKGSLSFVLTTATMKCSCKQSLLHQCFCNFFTLCLPFHEYNGQ